MKEATDGEVINGHYGIDCRTVLVRKMGQEILWAKVAKTATYMLPFCRKRVFERFEAPEIIGAPERIRTSDPQIRSLVLYPAELRAHPRCERAEAPFDTDAGAAKPL